MRIEAPFGLPDYEQQEASATHEMRLLADHLRNRIPTPAGQWEIDGILAEIGRLARLRQAYRAEIARLQKEVTK